MTLPLPAECETLVDPGEHMLSLIIDIDLSQLSELVRLFDEHRQLNRDVGQLADSKGLYLGKMNQAFSATALRLAQSLHSPLDADVLGQGLVREILFHVLSDPQSGPLFSLAMHNTHMARLERALKHMHSHYEQALDVDQLAGLANMSTSAFHRNFRQVTASSPIQYLKKLRLTRARELLMDQGLKVKQAAAMVGYDSPTQFSREFKRYFGQSPQQFVPR